MEIVMDEDFNPYSEAWVQRQTDLVLDLTRARLIEELGPCEAASAMKLWPRARDHVELEVRRRAARLANAMRESEAAHEVRH